MDYSDRTIHRLYITGMFAGKTADGDHCINATVNVDLSARDFRQGVGPEISLKITAPVSAASSLAAVQAAVLEASHAALRRLADLPLSDFQEAQAASFAQAEPDQP